MELSPKRRKAQAIMDLAVMGVMEKAMAEGIEPPHLVQPFAQKLAHLCATCAAMGKPVDIDDLLKTFRQDVSLTLRDIIGKTQ